MPNMYVPEREKDEDYYLQCINAVAFSYANTEVGVFNLYKKDDSLYNRQSNFDNYINLYAYIFGEQENIQYQFITLLPETQGAKPANWVPGKQIRYFVDKIKGQYMEKIQSAQITTKTYNANFVEHKSIREKLEIYLEFKTSFDSMAQEFGIPIQNDLGFLPNSKDDIEDYIADLSSLIEKQYGTIANSIFYQSGLLNKLIPLMVDVIVMGYGGFKLRLHNNKIIPEYCFAPSLFFDRTTDGDYREEMRYAGNYSYLTMPEIQERYSLTSNEISYIQDNCNSSSMWASRFIADLPGSGVLDNVLPLYGDDVMPKYLVIDAEWQDIVEVNYTYSTIKNGVELCESSDAISKMTKSQLKRRKFGRKVTKHCKVFREATLIGGCFLTNGGIRPFQSHSTYGTYDTHLSYFIFTPDMKFGWANSLIKATKDLQDDISAYNYKIQEYIEADKGVIVALNSTFAGTSALKFMEQIQSNRIAELDYSSIHSGNSLLLNVPVFQREDLSLSVDKVMGYVQLIAVKMRNLEEIFHLPPVSQGREVGIDNKSVQAQSVALANVGLSPLFKRMDIFIGMMLQYATNMQKDVLVKLDRIGDSVTMLGKDEMVALRLTKDMYADDIHVKINFDNPADKDLKEKVYQLMLAKEQNGQAQFTTQENIAILNASSSAEMEQIAIKAQRRVKKEQEKMMMQQQAQMQQQAMMQAQSQQQIADTQAGAKMSSTEVQEQQKNMRQEKDLAMQDANLQYRANDKLATLEDNEKDRDNKLRVELLKRNKVNEQ